MSGINNLARPPWTDKYKKNWDEAYENMMAWWNGESCGRPVVLTSVTKPETDQFRPANDPKTIELRDIDEQYLFEYNLHRLNSKLYLAESVPAVYTGFANSIGMLAGMAGAKLMYDDNTVWINEMKCLYDIPFSEFSKDYLPYRVTIDLMHRHAKYHEYDCILGSDAMMDPITVLSMIMGVENLCYGIADRPDDVKVLLDSLSEMRYKITEGYKNARSQYGRAEEINWTGAWAPGEMDCLECDFSTMISPEMFNELVMPEVEKEASCYKYCLWHLDGPEEIKHLESICSVSNIYAIQWVVPEKCRPVKYIELFRKVRKLKRSLLIQCLNIDEAEELIKETGKDGIALQIGDIKDEKEMETALKRLKNI